MVQNSYPIYGQISGAAAGVTVTAVNLNTGETLTAVTVIDSSYLIDCANFTSGYTDGDLISISAPGYKNGSAEIDIINYESGRKLHLVKISGFDVFDWPYAITKIEVTEGSTNADGSWIAETVEEMIISGHVSDVTQKELQYMDPALIRSGVRKIAVEQPVRLDVNDRVQITEADEEVTEWIVHAKQNYSGLLFRHMGIKRETFLLRRRT